MSRDKNKKVATAQNLKKSIALCLLTACIAVALLCITVLIGEFGPLNKIAEYFFICLFGGVAIGGFVFAAIFGIVIAVRKKSAAKAMENRADESGLQNQDDISAEQESEAAADRVD